MSTIPKSNKISITGDLGSGKSTVCGLIKEKYGFTVYSTGVIQRSLAEKYGMTTLQFNKYMEDHPEIDQEIDDTLTRIGKENDNIILDSRLAWNFVPDSFKVYLSVELDTAADRILEAQRGSVESYANHEDAKTKILQRKASENLRYSKKYGVDCSNLNNYDIVIDTTHLTPQEIADMIINKLYVWKGDSPQL
jgi:cytidylate kinase